MATRIEWRCSKTKNPSSVSPLERLNRVILRLRLRQCAQAPEAKGCKEQASRTRGEPRVEAFCSKLGKPRGTCRRPSEGDADVRDLRPSSRSYRKGIAANITCL